MDINEIVNKLEEVIAHLREDGDKHKDIPNLRAVIAQIQSQPK